MPAQSHIEGTQIKRISFHKTGHPDIVAEEYLEDNLKSRSTPDNRTNLEKENERFVKTESKEQIQKDRKSNRPFEKQKSEPQIPKSRIKIRLYADKKSNRHS